MTGVLGFWGFGVRVGLGLGTQMSYPPAVDAFPLAIGGNG